MYGNNIILISQNSKQANQHCIKSSNLHLNGNKNHLYVLILILKTLIIINPANITRVSTFKFITISQECNYNIFV